MDIRALTRDQKQRIVDQLAPSLDYVTRLRARLDECKFPYSDRLFSATQDVQLKLEELVKVLSDEVPPSPLLDFNQLIEGLCRTSVYPYNHDREWVVVHVRSTLETPYRVEVYRIAGKVHAVRCCPGKSYYYYVPEKLLPSCVERWWLDLVAAGTRHFPDDPVSAVRDAAQTVLDHVDRYTNTSTEDAKRFVSTVGRDKVERLAGL